MTILKRAGSALVTGAALAGVLALSASSALAATNAGVAATWTVKPGGAITAKAGKTTLTDKSTGSQTDLHVLERQGHRQEGQRAVRDRHRLDHRAVASATAPARWA